MKLMKLQHALACLAILCLHGLACAEVPVATAQTLMHKSGVWTQLADMASHVKAGMAQSTPGAKLSADEVKRLDQVAEDMASMQINTAVAVLRGVANAMPNQAAPSAAELRKSMEAQRPQMVASGMGVVLSMFALTYQNASDKALEQYVKFLSSKSGAALITVMMDALDQSLSAAAQRLGSGILQVPGTTNL